MKHTKILMMFIVAWGLFSCGGGGGGTSVEQEPLKRLYFIDAPVNGLNYSCGLRESVTTSEMIDGELRHGVAQCRKGSVTFSIGSLVIGSLPSYSDHQKIYLADFIDVSSGLVNNEALIKLGMLLQSLDDDGDIGSKIDIDQSVGISSLDDLSIASLGEYITTLGKTPRSQEVVVEHIVSWIDPKYGRAPSMEPIALSVSIDEMVGNTVASVSIDQGDGELLKMELSGEGSEYFEIVNNSEIRLKEQLSKLGAINLTLTAMNKFGQSSGSVSIEVVQNRVVQIGVGKLALANIKIYRVKEDGIKEFITETTSDTVGYFDPEMALLDDISFYIYEIQEGNTTDIDIDNDGIQDSYATPNLGVVRLITTKAWLSSATKSLHASALGEILYLYSVDTLINDHANFGKRLDQIAKMLLKEDINGDGKINAEDCIVFNVSIHKDKLNQSVHQEYDTIVKKILMNDTERFKAIFDTKVIKAFDQNSSGCSPTTLCTLELQPTKVKFRNGIAYSLSSNRLYIYDTVQNKTLSTLDLPSDDYGIYLDTSNRIFLSAEDRTIISVDLGLLSEPTLIDTPLSSIQGYILGRIDSALLIHQEGKLIIMDISEIANPIQRATYDLVAFDQMVARDAYNFVVANEQLQIRHYNLENLQNITQVASHILDNVDGEAKVYMDESKNIYILTPHQSIGIYQIKDDTIELIGSLNIDATQIVSINDYQLYAYGNRQIYRVDTEYIDTPRIKNSFDFLQTTNDLYFDEDILYTPRYIIDVDALMLSSPYLRVDEARSYNQEYDIDLEEIKDTSMFAPF